VGASFTRSRRTVSAGSSTIVGNTGGVGATGGGRGSAVTFSDYSLPVDFSWELDVWGRVRRTVEAGEARAQASPADPEAVCLSAKAEVAQDYFQLCAFDAQKQVVDATVIAFNKSLGTQDDAVKAAQQTVTVMNQYNAGTASYLNVIVSQTAALHNERTAVDILSRRMTAAGLLIKALGGGWNASQTLNR
jgi:outer membrane protein TolC